MPSKGKGKSKAKTRGKGNGTGTGKRKEEKVNEMALLDAAIKETKKETVRLKQAADARRKKRREAAKKSGKPQTAAEDEGGLSDLEDDLRIGGRLKEEARARLKRDLRNRRLLAEDDRAGTLASNDLTGSVTLPDGEQMDIGELMGSATGQMASQMRRVIGGMQKYGAKETFRYFGINKESLKGAAKKITGNKSAAKQLKKATGLGSSDVQAMATAMDEKKKRKQARQKKRRAKAKAKRTAKTTTEAKGTEVEPLKEGKILKEEKAEVKEETVVEDAALDELDELL